SKQGTFGDDGLAGFKIVQRCEGIGEFRILQTRLNANCALADGGHADFWRQNLANAITPAEAIEAGFGEQNRVVLAAFDFAETCIDVPTQFAYVEIATSVKDLRLAAQAAGTDTRTLAKRSKRFTFRRDEAIAGIFAPAD